MKRVLIYNYKSFFGLRNDEAVVYLKEFFVVLRRFLMRYGMNFARR